mgnify:CR=1 FL=1
MESPRTCDLLLLLLLEDASVMLSWTEAAKDDDEDDEGAGQRPAMKASVIFEQCASESSRSRMGPRFMGMGPKMMANLLEILEQWSRVSVCK